MGTRGFWLINATNFLDGCCYFGFLNLLTLFLGHQLHLTDKPVGWMVGLYTGLVTLFMIQGGGLVDRIGARATLRLALLWLLAGRGILLASAYVNSAPLAALALLLMAYGTGLVQPSVYAGVKETVAPGHTTMGYAVLYGIMNAGVVTWSLISPYLRGHFGVLGIYAILLGLTLFNLLLQLVPIPPRVASESLSSDRRLVEGRFLAFIFLLVPVRMLVAHLWLTLPSVLERAYPQEVSAHLEWCNGLNALILALATPLLTRWTRTLAILPLMIGGTLLSAISVFFLVLPGAGPLATYLVLFSLGEAVWASRFYEYIANAALPGRLGAAMGLANLPWFLAKSTAALYSGAMLEHFVPAGGPTHSGQLWAIYGAVALITPLGLFLARRQLSSAAPPEPLPQ